ncbi:ArsR/SmtB family transcription factor [Bogoriella caseilytica]|uniref:ArsR family transcriptional regulator n=1 Tax=Bogoriella caseilytica TaxID=56055 RepID=A0A3N2BCB3_9MICO|nr:metalloregulator ArsR/SmtB family transcription factor [Bogoriella caseilytica]ROR72907.1 ArsR family transcriptional regulator [Bogoriella caseilytica]
MLDHDRMDLLLHALGDRTRRNIVERLTAGPASASQLARPHQMTLSAVMQHLAVLERAGLVRSQKIGRVRSYQLDAAPLRAAESWMSTQRTAWEAGLDRLSEVLMQDDTERG